MPIRAKHSGNGINSETGDLLPGKRSYAVRLYASPLQEANMGC